jgi:hypothetical protein
MRSLRWCLASIVILPVACGAPRPEPKAARSSGASSAPAMQVAPPGPGEWDTWDHARKLAYMKGSFMEEERRIFATWEPVRFRALDCRTCHGPGVEDEGYRMPNPDLPHLFPGKEGYEELFAHEPEAFRFMQKTLVPETARLLGLPAFDMEKHTGFSCYQCHVKQGG